MRESERSSSFATMMRYTVFPAVALPVAAWIWVQRATEDIRQASEFTGALVHTLSVSTFAVILAASMLTNAIIVTNRARFRPQALERNTAFPLWQLLLLLTTAGWVWVVGTNRLGGGIVETILALAIAVLSVFVFVWSVRRDHRSDAARARWVVLKRHRLGPSRVIRNRRRTLFAWGFVVLSATAVLLSLALPATRTGCVFEGGGQFNGQRSLFSSNCGEIATGPLDPDIEQVANGRYTVTTQGYRLGLPPAPVLLFLQRE